MSSLEHFWVEIFKTFHEILCSRIFPYLGPVALEEMFEIVIL